MLVFFKDFIFFLLQTKKLLFYKERKCTEEMCCSFSFFVLKISSIHNALTKANMKLFLLLWSRALCRNTSVRGLLP